MPKFKIMTLVPDWTGSIGAIGTETHFIKGVAELDVVDETAAGRLAYFRSAGYGIEPLDDISIDDAIRRVTMTTVQEYAELERESAELDRAAELDSLRDKVAKKRERQIKVDAETTEIDRSETDPTTGQSLLPPPPDSDRVADWRTYAVKNLGVTDAQARAMSLQELRAEHRRVVDAEGKR